MAPVVRALDEVEQAPQWLRLGLITPGPTPMMAARSTALAEALVLGELGSNHFERDLAPEARFRGAIDGAHPPSPDERFDLVAGDRRSGRQHARDVTHRSSVRHGRGKCNRSAKCDDGDTLSVVSANDTTAPGSYSRDMRITRRENTMKRIATIGAIVTAFAVAPSVAAAENVAAQAKPQVTAQVIGVQTAKVQRAKAAISMQRHLVQVAQAKRFSLLFRAQIR